jgi:hypothetical protein
VILYRAGTQVLRVTLRDDSLPHQIRLYGDDIVSCTCGLRTSDAGRDHWDAWHQMHIEQGVTEWLCELPGEVSTGTFEGPSTTMPASAAV